MTFPSTTLAQLLLLATALPAAASSVYSFSRVSLPSGLYDDYRFGDPAISSVSHSDLNVVSDGGINYGAQVQANATYGRFSLFTFAGGSGTGSYQNIAYSRGQAQINYSDTITVPAGLGSVVVRIPFQVSGSVSVSTNASSFFGFTFCQAASSSGGFGCLVNGLPAFFNGQAPNVLFTANNFNYSQLFNLDFPVQAGVPTDFNFTVIQNSYAYGLMASSTADFSHTGVAQAAQVFNQSGDLLSNVVLTSQSGFNYNNPQSSTTPEPGALILASVGLTLFGVRFLKVRSKIAC
jgi:hypothetical protein